jgi:hypothetical protein
METTEVVSGTLKGMGWEVDCALLVIGVGRRPSYTRCTILQAPEWLPDGYYEASFRGQSAFLHRGNGAWSVGVPWLQVSPHRKAARPETSLPEWVRTLAG